MIAQRSIVDRTTACDLAVVDKFGICGDGWWRGEVTELRLLDSRTTSRPDVAIGYLDGSGGRRELLVLPFLAPVVIAEPDDGTCLYCGVAVGDGERVCLRCEHGL